MIMMDGYMLCLCSDSFYFVFLMGPKEREMLLLLLLLLLLLVMMMILTNQSIEGMDEKEGIYLLEGSGIGIALAHQYTRLSIFVF